MHKLKQTILALVAHACNPSYLGGWDREDCGSRTSLWYLNSINSWVKWCMPVISSYTLGWDQEDCCSKLVEAKNCKTPCQQKKAGCVWGPLVIPATCKV
jgi:hypothetical protein